MATLLQLLGHAGDLPRVRRYFEQEAAWYRREGNIREYLKARAYLGDVEREERRREMARGVAA